MDAKPVWKPALRRSRRGDACLEFWAGYLLLNLDGMLSSNFLVQCSTNLAGTNWVNLLSLTDLPSSAYLFLDPAGDEEPARFYRAFMQ